MGLPTTTRDPLVDSLFSTHLKAANGSSDTLQAAVGKLAKIVSKPCTLKWQPPTTSTVRYIDSVGGTVDALASASNDAAYREAHAIEYGVHITRQPYLRGAEVTLGPYTIPNNPASTDGRVKVVTRRKMAA